MTVKLLTEHNLEFQSLKGGCTGLSESTLVNMPHCWKSHVAAQLLCVVMVTKLKMSSNLAEKALHLGHFLLYI